MSTPLPVDSVTILPIRPVSSAHLDEIRGILQARGIHVALLPPTQRPSGAYDSRRHQFRAEVLLERARSLTQRPILAVTDGGCYAGTLNFVFGTAEVGGRIALISLHKLSGAPTPEVFHQRLTKELIHELAHAEGIGHCHNRGCVMQFSNSLAEVDAKSSELCSACRRRLRDISAPHRTVA